MDYKITIDDIRDLALQIKNDNGTETWLEEFVIQVYQQFINPLQEDLRDLNWYKFWHKKFRRQIDELTYELETYRPTRLSGNGQCKCTNCGYTSWTDFGFSRFKGLTLCDNCLKDFLGK